MYEQLEQQICIKFCLKLERSSMETIWMIQKASAMGNWWLAPSSRQCACWCITSHVEFFGETSNHPGDSGPLEPRFGDMQLQAFPKTKITFEREDISDHWWDSGKYDSAAYGNWKKCVRSQGLLWRGLRSHCPMYSFLYLVSSSTNVFFLYYMDGYLLDRPHIPTKRRMHKAVVVYLDKENQQWK